MFLHFSFQLFWNVLSVLFSFLERVVFFSFFSEHKADRRTKRTFAKQPHKKKGKTKRQQAQFQQKTFFRKVRITQKGELFFFLFWNVISRSFSSCFFPILKGKRVIKCAFFG